MCQQFSSVSIKTGKRRAASAPLACITVSISTMGHPRIWLPSQIMAGRSINLRRKVRQTPSGARKREAATKGTQMPRLNRCRRRRNADAGSARTEQSLWPQWCLKQCKINVNTTTPAPNNARERASPTVGHNSVHRNGAKANEGIQDEHAEHKASGEEACGVDEWRAARQV